ncbi:replicative DNA helicase [Lutibacter sp. B2]|nr:replicative DNA helicase [Lutibacter sp. B2]
MVSNLKGITENYRERIQKIALFDALFKLENKKGKDEKGQVIDYFSLGLLTLLFFFENMLMRNKKTGVKELAKFFQEMNQGEIELDYEGFEKVARNIIELYRPSSGKRNFKEFYNWETRKEEIVQYSILKTDQSDVKTNTQYYTLDEQGLELIFATKEYFSEFQLSINQLVLRKQLEKGEFVGALRQIDEMRIDVKTLQDRIMKIKHEVQRNIISDETYERYKIIVEDINLRLKHENQEFEELQAFARETKERIGYELTKEKDRKTYELIIRIDRELGEVHHEHRKLLQESIILKTSALQAAQESLYYVGIDSFNFEQEIVSRFISSPLPLEAARILIEPFLNLERSETWSPLTVFACQKIEVEERKEKIKEFLDLSDEKQNRIDLEIQRKNFRRVIEIIVEVLGDQEETTLEEVVLYMKENEYESYLNHRSFYDFWIVLHQRSPIKIENIEDENKEHLFDEVIEVLNDKADYLSAVEINGIVTVNDRYSIRNMKLEVKSIEL